MARKKKLKGIIDDYPLVRITCLDWISHSEWMSISKARRLEPSKCIAVGHLFTENRSKVQIFGSYSEDEDGIEVGTIETIPSSWVLEIKNIITGKIIK